MKVHVPVVVVGAGLAGLAVASDLAGSGIPCRVLESQVRTGGRIHTVEFPDGVLAEAHMEEFWAGSPAYPLLHRFGLALVEDTAHSSLLLDSELCVRHGDGARDDYLAGVFDAAEREAFVAWNARVRGVLRRLACREPDVTSDAPLAALTRTSLRSYVQATTSAHRVAEWIRVVVESETAVEWDRIAALDGLAELQPFLDTPAGFGERNAHVVGGNRRLVEALTADLPDGAVRTGTRVTRVIDQGRYVDVCYRDHGRENMIRCEQAVLTVPCWALRQIDLRPELGRAAAAALATSAAGSYVKVILRLQPQARRLWADHGPNLFTLLTDGPAGCLYLGAGDPDDDTADLVLTMLVHGPYARGLNGRPVEQIQREAICSLESLAVRVAPRQPPTRLLPGISRLVTDVRVYDYPRAVAYWPIQRGRSRFDALATALRAPHGRVHIGGDTTESSHSDGAVRSAHRMASVVAGRLGVAERRSSLTWA